MSFSMPGSGGANPADAHMSVNDASPGGMSVNDAGNHTHGPGTVGGALGNYFKSRNPVVGGLADLVFGGGNGNAADHGGPALAAINPAGPAPMLNLPDYSAQPDQADLIGMNAQPKQGGGLSTIIKLLTAGG